MISFALLKCCADPSFVIGGTVPQLGGGSRSGASPYFVAEACEYDRSFHHLRPRIALITNIEEDHLDCYRDIEEIVEAFHAFAALVPPHTGLIVANSSDADSRRALCKIAAPIEWCALTEGHERSEQPDWTAKTLDVEHGCHRAVISYKTALAARLKLSLPGKHNLMNAMMAIAACRACGIDPQLAADAIGEFRGVDRRMTEVGRRNGAVIVDDYGHHPTEIRATLRALREKYEPKRLFCVFQPHQHSRTRFLLDDFAMSFADATETIVPDIYFVRDSEAERQAISAKDLVGRIIKNGQSARHLSRFEEIVDYLKTELRAGDLIVTMGAGNVWEIGKDLAA
jgi:UDP-N-acetylmuramate--alanine ligase